MASIAAPKKSKSKKEKKGKKESKKSKRESKRENEESGTTIAVPSPFADENADVAAPWDGSLYGGKDESFYGKEAAPAQGYPVPSAPAYEPSAPYLDPNGDPIDFGDDFDPFHQTEYAPPKSYFDESDDSVNKVNYAGGESSSTMQKGPSRPPAYFGHTQQGGRGRSATSGGSSMTVHSGIGPYVEEMDGHVCPGCKLQWLDPLPALVLDCPRCEHKYCFFCNMSLNRDGLPCAKKYCKRQRKIMWAEEDAHWKQQQVDKPKEKGGKKMKRRATNAAYGAGVAACATTSGVYVLFAISFFPFASTQGIALASCMTCLTITCVI